MALRGVSCTSVAGRRETNQDRVHAARTTIGARSALVLAVSDGMGGMTAGDRAAQIAIDGVAEFARTALPRAADADLHGLVEDLFQDANRKVFEFGVAHGAEGTVGATLVCAILGERRFVVGHVGDSRLYYINRFEIRQLTEDHSSVADMVRAGVMTTEAARRSPFRSQLTNSLGERGPIRVDLVPPAPCLGLIDEPCVFLLASDGLFGELEDDDLLRVVHRTASVEEAGQELCALALERGSADNISVVAAELGRLPRSRSRASASPVRPAAWRPARTAAVGLVTGGLLLGALGAGLEVHRRLTALPSPPPPPAPHSAASPTAPAAAPEPSAPAPSPGGKGKRNPLAPRS